MITIPKGWEIAEEFSRFGNTVAVPAGSGYGAVVPVSGFSEEVGRSMRVIFSEMLCRIVDPSGQDQIYFSLRRNYLDMDRAFRRINGVQFDQNPRFSVGLIVDGGLFDIAVYNKSGTTGGPEGDGGAAVSIQVQVGWNAILLREAKQSNFVSQYIQQSQILQRG